MARTGIGAIVGFLLGVGFSVLFLSSGGRPDEGPPALREVRAAVDGSPDAAAELPSGEAVPREPDEVPGVGTPDPSGPLDALLARIRDFPEETDANRMALLSRAGRLVSAVRGCGEAVPRSFVEELLADPRPRMRWFGLSLADQADEYPSDAILRLLRKETSEAGTVEILRHLGPRAAADPSLLDAVLGALRHGPSTAVRGVAMGKIAAWAPSRPELVPLVTEAVNDRDLNVREAAVEALPDLGAAGADAAEKLLAQADCPGDYLEDLLKAVIRGGRLGDVLDRGLSSAALRMLPGLVLAEAEGQPEVLEAARGRLGVLLDAYVPTTYDSYQPLIELADRLEDHAFLRECVLSGRTPDELVAQAMEYLLCGSDTVARGLDLAEEVIRKGKAGAEVRWRIVRSLPTSGPQKDRALRLLGEVAASDPSSWVRAAAREEIERGR